VQYINVLFPEFLREIIMHFIQNFLSALKHSGWKGTIVGRWHNLHCWKIGKFELRSNK
jgi:hypothetical protein